MKIFYLFVAFFMFLNGLCQEKLNNTIIQSDYSYQYALIEASRQKMIGNVNEAVNLYLNCISANPECDVAYYELGTVYSALGQNDKAENMLSHAYELNQGNYWYGIAYSELLKLNKNSAKSLKVLKRIRKLNETNSITVDFKISEILTEEHKYTKALFLLEKIEEEYGISEIVSFKKFEIYKLQKEFGKAEAVIYELINSAPEIAEYQILIAEYYGENGDSVRALEAYEKAFNIDSSNIYAITNLADLYSAKGNDEEAFYFLNQAFLNKNITVNSKIQTMMFLNKDRDLIRKKRVFIEDMVSNLLSEYPDNVDINTVAYDFYNGIEEHNKALIIIKHILNLVKDDYIIWQQALYTASMLEDYEEIIIIGEEALKYFPNKSEFYLFVGMAYFQNEKFEDVYNILTKSFSSVKNDNKIKIQFLLFLAESAYKTDRKAEAFLYYDQLVEADPSNDFTKNNYSYYLALDSINLLKAKKLSYSTLINSPENSTFLDTYAWVLFKLGMYDLAKSYSKKALVINGENDSDIIFHFAEILAALKEYDLSDKYFKLAEERGYDRKIIEKRLKDISEYY